jgi:hypothetical protein
MQAVSLSRPKGVDVSVDVQVIVVLVTRHTAGGAAGIIVVPQTKKSGNRDKGERKQGHRQIN